MPTEVKMVTGYRLRFHKYVDARAQQNAVEMLKRHVVALSPTLQIAAQEPFFMDDYYRGMNLVDAVMAELSSGELFTCFDDDALAAIAFISNIKHERSGYFQAWVHPDYRSAHPERRLLLGEFAAEILSYAFKPFGPDVSKDGLGLIKLKAEIAIPNRAAVRAAAELGFQQCGFSPLDALHHGQPCDTILLELHNPAYFSPAAVEVLPHVRQQSHTENPELRAASGVHAAAAVRVSGGPEPDYPGSDEPEADNEPREVRRITAPVVDAVVQQPAKPRRIIGIPE